jgi:hypothetical protein
MDTERDLFEVTRKRISEEAEGDRAALRWRSVSPCH